MTVVDRDPRSSVIYPLVQGLWPDDITAFQIAVNCTFLFTGSCAADGAGFQLSAAALAALQWEFLSFFFQGDPPFFLTEGTPLSAFCLQLRYSEYLDLFTSDSDAFDRVPLYINDTATRLNGSVALLQIAPQFRRYRLS